MLLFYYWCILWLAHHCQSIWIICPLYLSDLWDNVWVRNSLGSSLALFLTWLILSSSFCNTRQSELSFKRIITVKSTGLFLSHMLRLLYLSVLLFIIKSVAMPSRRSEKIHPWFILVSILNHFLKSVLSLTVQAGQFSILCTSVFLFFFLYLGFPLI